MRGKVSVVFSQDLYTRITPAYAGKSHWKTKTRGSDKDHPRLCGEKTFQFVQFFLCVGSPPPMRGKADLSQLFSGFLRITPAYAGKSSYDFSRFFFA